VASILSGALVGSHPCCMQVQCQMILTSLFGFSRERANPPDVLYMRVICPDAGIKDPNFHLGTIVALVPKLLSLKASSDAVLREQQPPLSLLRQLRVWPGDCHISCGIFMVAVHGGARLKPADNRLHQMVCHIYCTPLGDKNEPGVWPSESHLIPTWLKREQRLAQVRPIN